MPKGIYQHKPPSEEQKRKMSLSRLGKPSPMKGRKHTEETKRNMIIAIILGIVYLWKKEK